jgi:hypothetical protein
MRAKMQSKSGTLSEQRPDMCKQRMEKIQQLLADALQQPDPLQANLGVAVSDLMSMGFWLKQAIDELLASEADPLQHFQKVSAPLEAYLKITRQWDRLVQLDRRLTDGRRNDAEPESR